MNGKEAPSDDGHAAVDLTLASDPMLKLLEIFSASESRELTLHELSAALQDLGLGSDDALQELLLRLDTNGDGLVSYEDIKLAMSYYVESQEASMQSPDSVDGDNGNGPAFEYRAVTIEQTGDPREMLEAYLLQLVGDQAFPEGELAPMLQLVDELSEAIRSAQETAHANDRDRCEQAEKDARELQHSNAMLSDEYHKMEQELGNSMVYKRQAEDRAAELRLRDEELAAAQAEMTVLTETQAQLEQATGAAEQLQAQVRVQEAQSKETLDHIGRIEAARDLAQTQAENMMAERDELIEQLRQLTDKLETEGFVVRGQTQQTDKLSERNAQLQERTEEFREIVTMKDLVITKLRRTIDDQTLLIQSLRLNSTGNNHVIQGSLMNEIADFVASETRGRQPADEPRTPSERRPAMASLTVDEPPALAGDTMAAAQPLALATPHPTPPAIVNGNGAAPAATPASNAADPQSAAPATAHAVAAAVEASPRSPGPAADSIAVDVSLSPFKSPGTLRAIVGKRPGEGEATLETRMNMYTVALKQHAAGLKIVTRESAMRMGVDTLEKLAGILKDLTSARSIRLINALDEREQLENDAAVKKRVLAHIIAISKARAGPGPPSTPSKMPDSPVKFKSLSPLSGSPKNGGAASGKQPGPSASAPADTKPPPAKDRSWFRRF